MVASTFRKRKARAAASGAVAGLGGAPAAAVVNAEQFLTKEQMVDVLRVKLKRQTDYAAGLEDQVADKDTVIGRLHAQNRSLQQQLRVVTQAAASLAAGSGAVSSALLASKTRRSPA